MENENKGFTYTYSPSRQEEIRRIREKYAAVPADPGEEMLATLRRLDAKPQQTATAAALILGILGALIMGSGMSLVMTDIGFAMGFTQPVIPGILVGLFGMVLALLAYPAYRKIEAAQRKKVAPQILQLTEELMK